MIKRGITNKIIILFAILLTICLLLPGCGGKSTFDGSGTSDGNVDAIVGQNGEEPIYKGSIPLKEE